MSKLDDLAVILRSKNAGPFYFTFDILFDKEEIYQRVKKSGVLKTKLISTIYKTPEESVKIIYYDAARALKITIPRKVSSGSLYDTDVYGAQQHVPLMDIDIP